MINTGNIITIEYSENKKYFNILNIIFNVLNKQSNYQINYKYNNVDYIFTIQQNIQNNVIKSYTITCNNNTLETFDIKFALYAAAFYESSIISVAKSISKAAGSNAESYAESYAKAARDAAGFAFKAASAARDAAELKAIVAVAFDTGKGAKAKIDFAASTSIASSNATKSVDAARDIAFVELVAEKVLDLKEKDIILSTLFAAFICLYCANL
jgi:hypothetical protein